MIKKFENFNINNHTTYDLYYLDKNGDEIQYNMTLDINPFDIHEVYTYYLHNKKRIPSLFIVKVTREKLSIETIELELKIKDYNL